MSILLSPSSIDSANVKYGPQNSVKDLIVFNVDSWPTSLDELKDFGRDEISRLVKWFEVLLEKAGCVVKDVPEQWISTKTTVRTQFNKIDFLTVCQTLLTKEPYKSDMKDVLHLLQLLLVLPVSAAQCERGVSAQNRIKSSDKASLTIEVLETLIRIASGGPKLDEFERTTFVNSWFTRDKTKGERPRRPNFRS